MGDEPKKLPQSLQNALKKGEAIAKKPMPTGLKERLARLQAEWDKHKDDPRFRKGLIGLLNVLGEAMDEREREIAQLNSVPQRYAVKKTFVHKTDERYVQSHCVMSPERREITYVGQTALELRPLYLYIYSHYAQGSAWVWVWVDSDGWIMRDGRLETYLHEGLLVLA